MTKDGTDENGDVKQAGLEDSNVRAVAPPPLARPRAF